jgi:hypothetical protein
MSRKAYFTIFVVFILALAWCTPSLGQVVKGSISGTVADPQGAVVSGAQVKATNVETGVVTTTTSDSAGFFRINLLPAGTYNVDITFQGFKTAESKGVTVGTGGDSPIGKVALSVGDKTTTVDVVAVAPLIETTQSQISSTFTGETLSTFAGIQENQGLDRLALFVPGVQATRSDNFSNTNGGGFSSNGLRGRNNDQEVDGQNNNDNSVGGPALFVSDSNFVQQYVIITNNFGPEYGRNAGSVVNIITKSGTNTWHGSVFGTEYSSFLNALSNSARHANKTGTGSGQPGTVTCPPNPFNPQCNPQTGPNRSHEEFSGGTVGGPIVKNKWFIFGGFDSDLFSGATTYSTTTNTPTPAGLATLAGCFSSGIPAQQVATLTKFGPWGFSAGNPQINGTPQLLAVNGCPGVQEAGISRLLATPFHGFDFPLKLDGQLGASDTFMARYLYNRGNNFNTQDNGAAGWVINVVALSQAMLLSETHSFTSHMVNEFRVGFDRINVDFGGNTIGNSFEPGSAGILNALANVSIANNVGFGPATNLPQGRIVNDWQVQDNWNWVHGKHNFKAGVNWTYQRSPNVFLPNINGQFAYDSLSGYVAGVMNPNPAIAGLRQVTIAQGQTTLDFREYDTFLYGGDDWKLTQNLTLNLGLTWTYYGNPAQLFTDITTKRESNPATAFWRPGLPAGVATNPPNPTVKNSFGPSIGFAYSPQWGGFITGHGKTVFRGGYRLLYDPPFYNIFLNTSTSSPFGFLQTLNRTSNPALPANIAFLPGTPTGPNARASLGAFIATGVFDPRTQNETILGSQIAALGDATLGPDKVHSWSFGFERELTKNAVVEARYVGNLGRNLYQTVDGNPYLGTTAPPAPNGTRFNGLLQDFPGLLPPGIPTTACQTTTQQGPGAGSDVGRTVCGLGVVRARTNGGFSSYHGVQTEFRATNLFKQLTIRAGYTWSGNTDNVSEIFATGTAGNTLFAAQNPFLTGSAENSTSGLNFPNQFTVAFTENLPFFKEQHGIGHLLGGWAISGSYVYASGQPFTPRQGAVFTAINSNVQPNGNYFDTSWANAFVGDPARPFYGNRSAPNNTVGIYCGDLAFLFIGTAATPGAVSTFCAPSGGNNALLSLNALNAPAASDPRGCLRGGATCPLTVVTTNDVKYIINMRTAQKIFGTPFGNVARNPEIDAPSNRLDMTIRKNWKLSERMTFETRMTATNALNHFNYSSIDSSMEDAGLGGIASLFGVGFNKPAQTAANGRVVSLSGNFRF